MENIAVWKIFGIIAIILLVAFGRKRNAVWGGFTIGIIIGFIIAMFSVFRNNGFDWYMIGKGAVSGTMVGFIGESLGKVSDLIKRK